MKNRTQNNKLVIALILIPLLLQAALPGSVPAITTAGPIPIPLYDLIKRSDLILVAQSTEIVETPANKFLNKPAGGWIRFQVLEVWKGSLKKKSFTMGWGYYDYFGNLGYFGHIDSLGNLDHFRIGKSIPGKGKYLMFLKRGYRKILYGAGGFWRIKEIQFPGLEAKSEAVIYRNPVNHIIFPVSGQILLRDTTIKQMKNGKEAYRKAFLLNELRIYIRKILSSNKKKK
jgi:hypothetical protein